LICIPLLLVAISIVVSAVQTQPQTTASESTKSADEAFARKDWATAVQRYEAVVASQPENGQAWQNLGESFLQLKTYQKAAEAFQNAAQLKFRPLINQLNLARVFAASGDSHAALARLHEVAASPQGPQARAFVLMSSEFESLKSTTEYSQVLEELAPCRRPEFHQFDFWVGDWEVRDPAGNVVGSNLVTHEQEGCLLVEHWTSSRGGQTGTSFNYYHVGDGKWHQLYLSNSGNAGAFPPMSGEFRDNKVVLITDEKASPVFRWTWYVIAPGRVRQMAEQSNDGEKTWQTVWDSVYVDKKRAEK